MKNHYLTPNWPAPDNIKACTTLRFGGRSKPPFDSFNLSTREPSNTEDALANRELLKQELELKNEPAWISQVHGIHAIQADECNPSNPPSEADASYTRTPNVVCTVLTADCLPLLVCNTSGTEVAAIHAGWRGLQAGVIEATFKQLKTPPSDLLVWLGPAMGPKKFEVGGEVRDLFMQVDPEAEKAFARARHAVPLQGDKWLGNMYLLARQRLSKIGVTNIYGGDHCTYTEAENFFSFRRNNVTGRMANLIWIAS